MFEDAAAWFAAQKDTHRAEAQAIKEPVTQAQERAEHTRHEVTAEVETRARADGQELAHARARLIEARGEARAAKFGRKRTTARNSDAAAESVERIEQRLTQTWGTAPSPWHSITEWANTIAVEQADAHPEVRDAEHALSDVQTAKRQSRERQGIEQDRLTVEVYGAEQAWQMRGTFRIPGRRADAERARQRADEARRIIAELDARPVAETAEWLTQRCEQQRIEREALEARRSAFSPGRTLDSGARSSERPSLGLEHASTGCAFECAYPGREPVR